MIKKFNSRKKSSRVFVIIPALNEEKAIGRVIHDIPKDLVHEIVVVDNGSSDGTSAIAHELGAKVIFEPVKGYGNACLAGLNYISSFSDGHPDIIVFIDADYSDYPEEMNKLIEPIQDSDYDLVVGSRIAGDIEKNAMHAHAIHANKLISKMLSFLLRNRVTDLGPFRAIRYQALMSLEMKDKNYGWTVEMIIKATRGGLKIKEVPIRYRKRIGSSKISGRSIASIKAVIVIAFSILKYMIKTGNGNKRTSSG
jgi:glycosyltransferase involved in cell wall biosynthesis